jgi:hypothetical protein
MDSFDQSYDGAVSFASEDLPTTRWRDGPEWLTHVGALRTEDFSPPGSGGGVRAKGAAWRGSSGVLTGQTGQAFGVLDDVDRCDVVVLDGEGEQGCWAAVAVDQ